MRRKAFTLIELLCVIAIIGLLMAIALPSLSKARTLARSKASRAVLRSIDAGCEMFHNDFGCYPPSSPRCEPINWTSKPNGQLWGVHLIARAMFGVDTRGIDSTGFGLKMNYSVNMDEADYLKLPRKGAYVSVSDNAFRMDTEYEDTPDDSYEAIDMLVLVDSFSNPILYYAANPKRQSDFGHEGAVYNIEDNGAITGCLDHFTGWRFGKSDVPDSGPVHPLGYLGSVSEEGTFINKMHVEDVAKSFGTVVPKNPDRFILYSAGPDDTFGTLDDIGNW